MELGADVFRQVILTVRPQRRTTMTLAGDSMLPSLHPGDELLVDPPIVAPRVGDVVVFPHDGRVVAHRVIERDVEEFVCAGDASSYRKEHVPVDDVIGVVRGVRRGNRVVNDRPSSAARAFLVRFSLAARYYAAHLAHILTRKSS